MERRRKGGKTSFSTVKKMVGAMVNLQCILVGTFS
jgi:hypothetical protein